MKHEKSAGAVIFRNEKKIYYLVLHYGSGHWDFPKGHIEKGEDEKETAKREIIEETGIEDIKFISKFKKRITYFFRSGSDESGKNNLISKEVIFFLSKTKKKEVKISFEHTGYKWLPYKEAEEELTYKNAKNVLKAADKFLRDDDNKK